MEYRIRNVLAWIVVFCGSCVTSAQAYSIVADQKNARVTFRIFYLGYGKIEGRFDRIQAKLELNEQRPSRSTINIEIETASVNSNYKARDAYLRSPALLSTRRYPKAYFRSTVVKEINRSTVILKGDLTLRGITRSITVLSRLTRDRSNMQSQTFHGSTSIYLPNYGINPINSLFATKLFLKMRIDGIRR